MPDSSRPAIIARAIEVEAFALANPQRQGHDSGC